MGVQCLPCLENQGSHVQPQTDAIALLLIQPTAAPYGSSSQRRETEAPGTGPSSSLLPAVGQADLAVCFAHTSPDGFLSEL